MTQNPQNAINRSVLRRLSVQPERSTEGWVSEALDIVGDTVGRGATRLSEETGLSVMLARLYLVEQLRVALRAVVEADAGEARAQEDTLSNIAEAAQLSLPSLRRTFPSMDEVVEARQRVETTGKTEVILIRDQHITLAPFEEPNSRHPGI
ncbi:hypothetical protein IV500_04230 [Paeniglutamicibacter antarcticus]|uniref:Uncharacterized protein n=1 Tax=Arthrobacter terrae TaxID=2935737 RepID=A0A931G4B4_9MICC|nr:hypothetical protein [Arthrobacter terrae]MBG0738628.1 hypothetical protein [Arthrobacter terrae]